jgi:peptide/nickel transport system ATP-binding protein
LQVRDLTVTYQTRGGEVDAVDRLDLDLYKGEVLGLVGESGCGKSTLGKALMRMIQPPGRISRGQIMFNGSDLMKLSPEQMRHVRGRQISMIFQDPMTSLNPVQRLDDHIIEAIRVHEPHVSRSEALKRAQALVERLGIGQKRLNDYPHQLSGGMRQRIMIGLALALKASLIIADEPTTSLDVIVEAQFLDLLRELKDEYGLTILLISHNIGIVAELADRVAVMYAAKIAEISDSDQVFHNPLHPYAQGLLKSIPNISLDAEHQSLYRMEGTPPNLINPPSGCRFHPRCPYMMPDICPVKVPPLDDIPQGSPDIDHRAACWLHIPHDMPEGK